MERAPRDGIMLALACAGSFVVILDATIVSVALPAIRAGLGFSGGALTWVVNAYTLAFAGFLLLGGRLCDEFGVRRIFVLGMSLFTVALARAAGGRDEPAAFPVVQGRDRRPEMVGGLANRRQGTHAASPS